MGIRFTLLVPDKNEPDVNQHVLGGDVKLRDFARPLLAPCLSLDTYGCGDVTDLQGFYDIVMGTIDRLCEDPDYGGDTDFSYWEHLLDLARVALAFQEHGVPAKISLS